MRAASAHRLAPVDHMACSGTTCAGAIAPRSDVERIGKPLGQLQARIVGAVKEVFQDTAHITEVLGRAEDDCLSGQYVGRAGLEWCHGDRLDADNVRTLAPS